MAKVYGGRWQATPDKALGEGGQAIVFKVVDLRGEHSGVFALKRVLNPARHERFRREIEAIKTISHPNIIKLIDHSALNDTSGEIEKQFLVTPIAGGGDLSHRGRIELYKGSIDGVVQVGKQLAAALSAAHAVNVIHRDLKPGNVLFTGMGHEIWLADFGICLLREHERLTETGEVVGPWSFLAPELEDGSQLEVTPAADIYSLGKVLYYMISGGTTLPRERLDDPKYREILLQGERHRLLYSLLRQMISPLPDRIQAIDKVLEKLESIESWEKNALVIPLNQQALSGVQKLQSYAEQRIRVETENRTIQQQEAERLDNVVKGFEAWVQAELDKSVAYISASHALKCRVERSVSPGGASRIPLSGSTYYELVGGRGFTIENVGSEGEGDTLWIGLYKMSSVRVTFTVGPHRQPRPAPLQVQDYGLTMIPSYSPEGPQTRGRNQPVAFLTKKEAIGTIRGVIPSRTGRPSAAYAGPLSAMTQGFSTQTSQSVSFRISQWPEAVDKLGPGLTEAIGDFVAFLAGRLS